MRITCKCLKKKYVVTVNGATYTFTNSRDAWNFITNIRKDIA